AQQQQRADIPRRVLQDGLQCCRRFGEPSGPRVLECGLFSLVDGLDAAHPARKSRSARQGQAAERRSDTTCVDESLILG
ncbi:MAG: hypothetical protein KDA43_07845, partial [Hyphomonas sp.]|nr:hypothetical protein [Hyphomonas sp.]